MYLDGVDFSIRHGEKAGSTIILTALGVDGEGNKEYQIKFDTTNVPVDNFIFAGKAWQMYRNGEADPDGFGIFSSGPRGIPFIQSGLIRDVGALNKQELMCQR